jgi:PAS domain S-box-containing protein
MARPFESISTKLGLGALLIFGAIALISYGGINRFVDGAHWVDHTHRAMLKLEEFMSQLERIVATQRSYLVSGDERYLQRYNAAVKALPQQMQVLREMTADNPRQQNSIAALEPLVSGRLAVLGHGIELKKTARLHPASALPLLARGQAIMDQIRELVSQMKAEEQRLLEERSRAFEKEKITTTSIIVFGNLVASAFLLFAFRALTREIGERRKAEGAARRHAEEVEDLYNNAPCGYHSLDENGVFVRINDTELNWLGYTREEMVGKMALTDILTAQGKEFFRQNFPAIRERGWARNVEFDLLRKDGTILPASLSSTAVRDDSGNFLWTRSTLFDITERREVERRLHEAHAFLDSVFEHIPNMIFVKDAKDLRFVRFNKAGADLIGCTTGDLIGKNDYDFFPPDQAEFFTMKDRETLAGAALVDIPEEPIQTRDHGVRLMHTKKIPLLASDGTPRYLLGISEDITDRKQAERQIGDLNEKLEQRASQLEATNKELESFSYSVSHDLRSPLRAIDGFSLMLEEDYAASLDDEGRRLLQVIQDNSRKMAQLIDDLLAFSKLGRQPIKAAEVDMTALAEEAFQELRASAADHGSPRLVLALLPPARGDRTMLRQVWVNLLSNALKYSGIREEPLIEVTGQRNGTQTIYSVKDNGVGFDMRYYAKLFRVFQRLHSAEEFPGTGVGLAIVQRVVTRHGGRVWAEGKLNEGARFHFSLPKGVDNG